MKLSAKLIALLLAVMIFTWFTTAAVGQNITLVEVNEFSTETELPKHCNHFCATEDGLFMIPDYASGNVKIYEMDRGYLKLVRSLGQKNEDQKLSEPMFCFYNKEKGNFGVLDMGHRRIYLYERDSRLDFRRVNALDCRSLGRGIRLMGNGEIMVSGYIENDDRKPYELYSVNIYNRSTKYFLPSHLKYGLENYKQFQAKYRNEPDFKVIGIAGWFDVQGDDIYYVWEGNMRILKLNFATHGQEEPQVQAFGKKTNQYITPKVSQKLIELREYQDYVSLQKEKNKMSYIRGIFASNDFLFLVFERTIKDNRTFRIQFYSLDGKFKKEAPVRKGELNHKMWFDKEGQILYSLVDQPGNPKYKIYKYKIDN